MPFQRDCLLECSFAAEGFLKVTCVIAVQHRTKADVDFLVALPPIKKDFVTAAPCLRCLLCCKNVRRHPRGECVLTLGIGKVQRWNIKIAVFDLVSLL